MLFGGAGLDTLMGLGGRDLLFGGSGADTLDGGDDEDIVQRKQCDLIVFFSLFGHLIQFAQ